MLKTNLIWEFSRQHCLTICAVIVPSILLVTLATIILVIIVQNRAKSIITASLGSFLSLVMLLHVFSWFAIGVLLTPSYILTALAGLCLVINLGLVTIFSQKKTHSSSQMSAPWFSQYLE